MQNSGLGVIATATEQGGAYGSNLHPTRRIAVRINGEYHAIGVVSVAFVPSGDGAEFALVLDAVTDF